MCGDETPRNADAIGDEPRRTFAEQVQDAAAWLALYARPGTSRAPEWSYSLKHRVQRWAGRYCSSTAVVEAARIAGYRAVGEPTKAGNAALALKVGSATRGDRGGRGRNRLIGLSRNLRRGAR